MTSGSRPDDSILEETAEDLYENAPCGYLSTAPDGTIVKVNRTFLEWTGYSRAELVNRTRFHDLLTPGGRIYHETHYAPLLRMQGAIREIALELVRRDGSRLPVLVNALVRRDGAGTLLGTRTTVFNATDRKRYEQELLRARQREQAARRRAERLESVTATLAAAFTPGEVARVVIEALAAGLGASRAELAVDAADDAPFTVLHRHGPPPAGLPAASRTVIPLEFPAGPAGEIRMEWDHERALSDEERAFASACAANAAQALERARLHEEARTVARALQDSMLALSLPRDPRFAVATRYSAGVQALDVGGDWYDAFLLGRDCLGLVVGDVVGRGLQAATAMGQLRSAVRALALADIGPARVMERLDRFVEPLPGGRAATVVYCEVDLVRETARYACAGHPPPALLAPGAAPSMLWEGRSPPLAAHVGPGSREEAEAGVPAGSRLVLYSDGLVERRRAPIDAGFELLLRELARHSGASADELAAGVTAAMLPDTGASDDVCLLCAAFEQATA